MKQEDLLLTRTLMLHDASPLTSSTILPASLLQCFGSGAGERGAAGSGSGRGSANAAEQKTDICSARLLGQY